MMASRPPIRARAVLALPPRFSSTSEVMNTVNANVAARMTMLVLTWVTSALHLVD